MNQKSPQTVAVFGASAKTDRYSHMALMRLRENGHRTIPVNPAYDNIDGIPVRPNLPALKKSLDGDILDTLTLYLAPHILEKMTHDIVELRPRRVIFNPGTETALVQKALDNAGIPWQESCTLVLLGTGQF